MPDTPRVKRDRRNVHTMTDADQAPSQERGAKKAGSTRTHFAAGRGTNGAPPLEGDLTAAWTPFGFNSADD